jgi:2'-5' RNA ligase
MTIGYAILLNDECHNFVRQIQLELHQNLGLRLARQSPHITIKAPFETEDIKPHIAYLETLAATINPFEIEFNDFGTFGDKVIYLAPSENPALLDLHHQVLAEVADQFNLKPHQFEGENIRFHASIAGFSDAQKFKEALGYLQSIRVNLKFQIKTLGLFYYLGEGGWIINRRIKLENNTKQG